MNYWSRDSSGTIVTMLWDHLIWDCKLLKKERNTLRKRIIAKGGR
jgi:hypothetical protein